MDDTDNRRVVFRATLPPIQTAISISGDREGGRVRLDVPESDLAALVRLAAMAEMVLIVTVEPEEEPD